LCYRPSDCDYAIQTGCLPDGTFHFSHFHPVTKNLNLAVYSAQVNHRLTRSAPAYTITRAIENLPVLTRHCDKDAFRSFFILPVTGRHLRPTHQKLTRAPILHLFQVLVRNQYFHVIKGFTDWHDPLLTFLRRKLSIPAISGAGYG